MIPKEEQKQVALLILKSIDSLKTGKEKMTSFLHGSHSKLVREPALDRKVGYGALFWYDLGTIKGFITQLEEMQLIQSYTTQTGNYSYPILVLSNAGKKALENCIEIPLQIRKIAPPPSSLASEKITLQLFRSGKSIPEICTERNLKLSTIMGHLAELVTHGMIKSSEFISSETITLILQTRKEHPNSKLLGDLKKVLPLHVSYEEIKSILNDKSLNHELGTNKGE